MPENIDRALNMATIATNAEKEEKALGTVDWGNNARVFAVRGSRGNAPRNRYEKPRGKYKWSGTGGAVPKRNAGPVQYSSRVDGTYSDQTDNHTPTDAELWTGRRTKLPTDAGHRQAKGEGTMSGLRDGDGRQAPCRPYGIHCYN